MAGIGGITGTLLAISFRMAMNPTLLISGVILVAGILGTVRMYLGKHSLSQILAGFTLGLGVLYLIVLFV